MSTKTRNEEYIERLLEVVDKDILQEVDGMYYYFPTGTGMLASHGLRIIADELDRRNKDWNEQINKYLGENNV
jgi:hypothetical protein